MADERVSLMRELGGVFAETLRELVVDQGTIEGVESEASAPRSVLAAFKAALADDLYISSAEEEKIRAQATADSDQAFVEVALTKLNGRNQLLFVRTETVQKELGKPVCSLTGKWIGCNTEGGKESLRRELTERLRPALMVVTQTSNNQVVCDKANALLAQTTSETMVAKK